MLSFLPMTRSALKSKKLLYSRRIQEVHVTKIRRPRGRRIFWYWKFPFELPRNYWKVSGWFENSSFSYTLMKDWRKQQNTHSAHYITVMKQTKGKKQVVHLHSKTINEFQNGRSLLSTLHFVKQLTESSPNWWSTGMRDMLVEKYVEHETRSLLLHSIYLFVSPPFVCSFFPK
jgi:hypothetical protein